MAYAIRTVICSKCGKPMKGRYKPNPPWQCFECSIKNMIDNSVSMHDKTSPHYEKSAAQGMEFRRQYLAKEGPLYDKWLAGIAKSQAKHGSSTTPPGPVTEQASQWTKNLAQ